MTGADRPCREQVILREDFTDPFLSEESPLYYKRTAEQAAGHVRFQREETRHGRRTIALSVGLPGPETGGLDSERAELWERRRHRLPFGTGVWYAFSMKIAPPVPRSRARHVVAQWKREIPSDLPGLQSPYLAFRMYRGHLYATIDADLVPGPPAGAAAPAPVWYRPEERQMRTIIAAAPNADLAGLAMYDMTGAAIRVVPRGGPFPPADSGWIDYVVYVRPDPGGKGHIEIFANGGHVVSVFGRIGHSDLGPTQYFKFGPYRQADRGSWTVYYDRFRRGPTCASVTDAVSCPF